MSKLVAERIEGRLKNGRKTLEIDRDSYIKQPGNIVQMVTNRTDELVTYSVPDTGDGTTIDALSTSITPIFSTSLLLITIMLNGEVHQDVVFLMHRDGQLITDSGYEAYNTEAGNVQYSGLTQGFYDNNEDTTPSNFFIQFVVPANNTNSQTFAPAFRSSDTDSRTLYLNRPFDGAGSDARETSISNFTIMEIVQ